ncbi:hypothetical protein niasHT_002375 [Heterodera trifolii]|uniref:B30.2/SPRY domain-containing protein n=1 Tax=Heterodera trifolii TaxID=157864 RepID=A0ABD2LN18_9BILA
MEVFDKIITNGAPPKIRVGQYSGMQRKMTVLFILTVVNITVTVVLISFITNRTENARITALEEQQKKDENFVDVLKDRFGNELLKAVHPDIRNKIAENFSIPKENCWDVNASHSDLEIFGSESLKVHYKGDGSGRRSVFAKLPILFTESGIFYFEIKIKNCKSLCSIGFATKATPLDGRVGQNSDSCAYQSDDTSDLFLSPPFGFQLFPFISLNDSGDLIETNFGPKFKFDPAKVQIILNYPRQNYWDANACNENLQIIGNKSLTVHFHKNISGYYSVFAKHSILLNKDLSKYFYYEISVKNMKNWIIFGFAVKKQSKFESIIQNGTYAYQSKGYLWINGEGKRIISQYSYGEGHTVGIGVYLITRQLFFTRNGQSLASSSGFFVAPSFADDSFYPFVTLAATDDKIEANFGPNFKFDLATL